MDSSPHSNFTFNRPEDLNGNNGNANNNNSSRNPPIHHTFNRPNDLGTLEPFRNSFVSKFDPKDAKDENSETVHNQSNPNNNNNGERNYPKMTPLLPSISAAGGPNFPHKILGETNSISKRSRENPLENIMNPSEASDSEYYRNIWEKTFLNMREEIEGLKLELALAQNLRYAAEERTIQLSYELQTMRISEAANYRAFVDLQKQIASGSFPPPNQWSVQAYKNQVEDLTNENKEVRKELSMVLSELSGARNEINRLTVKTKQPGANRKARMPQQELNIMSNSNSSESYAGVMTVVRTSNSKISERTIGAIESELDQRTGSGRTKSSTTTRDSIRETLEQLYSEELLIRYDDFEDQYFAIWVTEPVGVNVSILANDRKTELEVLFTWGDGVRSESVKLPRPIHTGSCKKSFPIPNNFKTREHPQKSFTFHLQDSLSLADIAGSSDRSYLEEDDSLPTDHEDEADIVDGFTIGSSDTREPREPREPLEHREIREYRDPPREYREIRDPPRETRERESKELHHHAPPLLVKTGELNFEEAFKAAHKAFTPVPLTIPYTTSSPKTVLPGNNFDAKKRFSEEGGATCFACHKHHISCDRKRPCANCTKKQIPCVEKANTRNRIIKKPKPEE